MRDLVASFGKVYISFSFLVVTPVLQANPQHQVDGELVLEATLPKKTLSMISRAERLFCSNVSVFSDLNLLDKFKNLSGKDFNEFVKNLRLDALEKINQLNAKLNDQNSKIDTLKEAQNQFNLPSIAQKFGGDYNWGYDSLVYNPIRDTKKQPSSKDFLKFLNLYGAQGENTMVTKSVVFTSSPYSLNTYNLDPQKVLDAREKFLSLGGEIRKNRRFF